jgi:hypothetical protein
MLIRIGCAALYFALTLLAAEDCWGQHPTRSGTGEYWKASTRSLWELLSGGYDLVSVISPNAQTRVYFLHAPGRLMKCTERSAAPPPPMPQSASPPAMGSGPPTATPAIVPPPNRSGDPPVTFECSELTRGSGQQ